MNKTIKAINEPVKSYASGSPERKSLQNKYDEMCSQNIEIPLIIGGKEKKTGNTNNCIMPHDHQHVLAKYHKAGESEVNLAIDTAMKSWKPWSKTQLGERTAILRKAAIFELVG